MSLILRWILGALALMAVSYFIPGITIAGFYSALIAALVLGLLNVLIRPLLMVLTLPINILTLGLFTLVINALLFWLVSSVVKGFNVNGFYPAFFGAIAMSIITWILGAIFK